MAQLEFEPRSLWLGSPCSLLLLHIGRAIVPEEDASLCYLPWHSLKVTAPIILSVTAVFPIFTHLFQPGFLYSSLYWSGLSWIQQWPLYSQIQQSVLSVWIFLNLISDIAYHSLFETPFSVFLSSLLFMLDASLVTSKSYFGIFLANVFIISSSLCNLYQKCMRGIQVVSKSSLNENDEFGGTKQTMTWKSWILLEPSLLCSYFVHIFITVYSVIF